MPRSTTPQQTPRRHSKHCAGWRTPPAPSTLRGRPVRHADFLVAADGAGMRRIAGLAAGHELNVHVAHVYPLSEAEAAYEQVASRRTAGKVVLIP
jgi:NADPH:quinone reductase-like Zn-dependent oxidoreductase